MVTSSAPDWVEQLEGDESDRARLRHKAWVLSLGAAWISGMDTQCLERNKQAVKG